MHFRCGCSCGSKGLKINSGLWRSLGLYVKRIFKGGKETILCSVSILIHNADALPIDYWPVVLKFVAIYTEYSYNNYDAIISNFFNF